MKRHTIAAALAAALMASSASAQIPVTDPLSIAARAVEAAQTIEKWVEQYNQMEDQIGKMQRQYDALTGSRNLGQIMNNPLLRNHLPEEWHRTYRRLRNSGVLTAAGTGLTIFNENHVFDSCEHHTKVDRRLACQARAVKGALDAGMALDAYELARSRIDQIEGLMTAIDTTEDPKGVAEIQGRIAAEQANIANEQTKLQLFTMIAEAEDKLQEQREIELDARTWAAEGSIQATPLTFD